MSKCHGIIVLMGLWVFGAVGQVEQAQLVDDQKNEVINKIEQQGFVHDLIYFSPLAHAIKEFIVANAYSVVTLSCTLLGLYINYYYNREQLACSQASLAQLLKEQAYKAT